MAPPPKKHYLSLLILLSLFALFIFSHYSLYPSSPSLSNPTSHFLSPQNPSSSSSPFTFTIKVLAFDRLPSLSRCLNSLSSAQYFGDTVNLHIFIDHFQNTSSDLDQKLENSHKILDFADGFKWDFGQKLVHYRTVNVGLQAQWLEAWWPSSDDEFVFVVEDDLEVSPLYYKFLKGLILNYYYNHSNFSPWIYGASLQRPRFVPGKHGNKLNLDNETRLFLYQLVGTWGQLLFPRPWKEFRLWYDDHKAKGIKPVLEGMRIWTPWFIKFLHSRGYFNIYTNFLHERALSVSHRDAGVNYGKRAGPDSELLDEKSHDINLLEMQSLSKLQWYDFCFKRLLPGRIANKLDEVDSILHTMEQQKPVVLVGLLKSSEAIVRNLICQFEKLDIRNYIFLIPNSKSDLLHDLLRRGHPVIVTHDIIEASKMSSSESINELVVKAYVIKKCLESDFDSWVVDSNMLPLSSTPHLDSTDSIESNFFVSKSSKFFFVRSSSSSLRVWNERFVQKFARNVESLVSEDSLLKMKGNFADVVEKFAKKHEFRLKIVDDIGFSLKLAERNQSLLTNTKMISWSPETDADSVQKHLEELGMWIIDSDSSCKAVICHRS
ncbi:tRNA uridine 5-carboxymethylaminomethyl modification enzyme MnmG [Bienertia sinuspersici]